MRQLRRKWKRQRQSFVLCVEKRKVNCNGPREMRTHVLEYRVCVTSWERMIKTRQKNEHYRRKFRSETPDTVNRWKAQPGRSSAMEKVRREDQRWRNFDKEKVTSEKMQVREKVWKSRNTVFLECFVTPDGRKVGSLKRRVRRYLGR